MPRDSARVLQLPLFIHDTVGYRDAVTRYEAIRPVLKGERSLAQQSRVTGINYWRLCRDLQPFQRRGLLGLIDRRTLPHARGHPWQNLAEGGLAIQRRMLDAYVAGCTDRESVYRQHAQFVQDYQFWGHWAHKRTEAQGRIYYLSPEVILGNARGPAVEPARPRRVFRLRQLTRQARLQGQIRLHNFGLYVDYGLSGQTVEVLLYDEAIRIEQAEHLLVSYPCVYDTRQRRITAVDGTGRQPCRQAQMIQLMFWALELAHTVWRMPHYRRATWLHRMPAAPQIDLFD